MESDAQQPEADRNNCRKHHELTSYNYQEHRPAKRWADIKEHGGNSYEETNHKTLHGLLSIAGHDHGNGTHRVCE